VTSPAAVQRMIRETVPPQARIGIVTAIASGSVTVSFGPGATTPGLGYNPAYVPAVGDQVVVIPTTSTWVVLCKVAPAPSLVPEEETVVRAASGWFLDRPVNFGPTPGVWSRYTTTTPLTGWAQGRQIMPYGSTQEQLAQSLKDTTTIGYFGSLAARVPSGSTINGVSVLWRRVTTGAPEPALVTPVLYGHAYAPGSPPPAATPTFTFGPYRYPPVAMGESARLTLAAELVTAWLSGAVTGLAIWSDRTADAFNAAVDAPGDVAITYTPPA